MVEVSDEIRSLSQALRDHLRCAQEVGAVAEPQVAPEDPPGAAREAPEVPTTSRQAPPEDPPTVEPAPPSPWLALAEQERSAQRPVHHDDGHGAEGLRLIREDLGDCERCGLCAGRKNLVFGVGDPDADLMVIGEGPGAQEDAKGEPFVGPAGVMLDKMLERVLFLRRRDVYIANVVKCRPPDNRRPSPQEAKTCLPFLRRQVQAIQPKLVLVLGSVALEYAVGVRGITRRRGQETEVWGVPAIPTFHPAYLLRRPEDKPLTFADLQQVRRRYEALGGRRSEEMNAAMRRGGG